MSRVPAQNSSTTQMPLVIPLFIADQEFNSTLILVNGTAASTYADVILRGTDGGEIVQERVTFPPNSQQQVDVASLLASKVSRATTGSILLMPSPDLQGAGIVGSLAMTYVGSRQPNYVDEELAMPSSNGSQTLRAAADPGEGPLVLAVTSLAEAAQNLQVNCFDGLRGSFSKSIKLQPGQTLVEKVCEDQTEEESSASPWDSEEDNARGAAGISLTSDAMPGSYAAFALAPHGSTEEKFFSSVPFTDPKMVMSPDTVFTGIPVGFTTLLPGAKFTPEISLANFSTGDIHVKVQFATTASDTSSAQHVNSLTVGAGSAAQLTLQGLQGDPGLQNSVIIESDGAPGDLLAKLVSRSDSIPRLVELLGKDEMDPDNGGLHPWSLQDGTDSTLLMFNHSGKSQYLNVMIAAGGFLWQKAYLLASMQTQAVSLRELIQDQIADDKGKKLPKDSEIGEVSWVTPFPGNTKGRVLQSNSVLGMARSFSCGQGVAPCGYSSINAIPAIPVGNTGTPYFLMPFCTASFSCYGNFSGQINLSGFTVNWQSYNTNIAKITTPNGYSATVTGVAPGSANLAATVSGPEPGMPYNTCSDEADGSVSVSPTISGPNTVWYFSGQMPSGYATSIMLTSSGGGVDHVERYGRQLQGSPFNHDRGHNYSFQFGIRIQHGGWRYHDNRNIWRGVLISFRHHFESPAWLDSRDGGRADEL